MSVLKNTPKETTVKEIEFDDDVVLLFTNQALISYADIELLKKEVDKKTYQLIEVSYKEHRIAIFLMRHDKLINGTTELVIVHCVGNEKIPKEIKPYSMLSPIFDTLAKKFNHSSVRIHSDRRALDRLLDRNGYKFQEAIFSKVLK